MSNRFVMYGAGAVGGVVGGRLHEHGYEVVLIARGAHYEAIRDGGLRLACGDEVATLGIAVVDDPRAIVFCPEDVVLLGMKTQDTAGALEVLAECAPPETPVVCVQNGVENERLALRRFARVYGVCVMCPTAHLEPGVVQAFSTPITGLLDVGRCPAGVDDVAEVVAEAFSASTFESVPRDDIMRWKYRKLIMNLTNAVNAVCGGDMLSGSLLTRVVEEGEAALAAAGIDVASAAEDADRRGDRLTMRPAGGERRRGGSSWQSLARGAGSIETDYLNGEVALLGRLHGVLTPANAVLQEVAAELARTGAPPGSVSEDDILKRLPDV